MQVMCVTLYMNAKRCYNVYIDPVSKCYIVPKVFLLQNGARKGRFANYFAILWMTLLAGSIRPSLSGFLYEK